MAEEVSENHSVDLTTRVPPGNAINASFTTIQMCGRAASAKHSIRMPTIPTIGNAPAVLKTSQIGICVLSAKRQTQMVSLSEVVVKALAVAMLAANSTQKTGTVPAVARVISPNAVVASSAPLQIQTDHSEITGNALNATSQTSPVDSPVSSVRNRIRMVAAIVVVRASVAVAEEADEVDVEVAVGEEPVVAEEAVSEEAGEAAVTEVFPEMTQQNTIKKSLLTSRAA